MRRPLIFLLLLSLVIPTAIAQPSLVVELNDATLDILKGELTISRLDTQLKVSMLDATPTASISDTELRYVDYTCKIYETDRGLEWDIILAEPPKASEWSMKVEGTDLSWYYQPPLNEEYIEPGYTVNATHVYDAKGELLAYRPIDVVGSYAVYGSKYGTGKVFHVYRPRVYDSKGAETWGTLSYSDGVLTVFIDPEWLAKATYPVTIDPIWGYTSIGGSNGIITSSGRPSGYVLASKVTTNDTRTPTTMYVALKSLNVADQRYKAVIYEKDSIGANNHGYVFVSSEQLTENMPQNYAWYQISLSGCPQLTTGKDYLIGSAGNKSGAASTCYFAYDNPGTNYDIRETDGGLWNYATPPASIFESGPHAYFYSCYLVYNVDTTPPTNTGLTSNETHIRYPCEFNATLQDETALSHYIFSWNASGAWVNMTAVDMGGAVSYNASVTRTLPLNESLRIGAELYFNDTSDNWGSVTTTLTTTGDTGGGMFNILMIAATVMGSILFVGVKRR